MQFIRRGWPVLVAGLILVACGGRGRAEHDKPDFAALFPPPAPGTEDAPAAARNERALLELARSFFEDKAYNTAEGTLLEFLRQYPQSRQAAEATYRLALACLLQGHAAEARAAQEQLLDRFPDSPWARLVLEVHCTEEQLRHLANARRLRAGESTAVAKAACDLLELYRQRFPDGKMKAAEAVYKMGVCQRLAGNLALFEEAMRTVRQHDADGDWGKLAALQLGDTAAFQAGMAEGFARCVAANECQGFLELAAQHEAKLDAAGRVKCRFWKAMCLDRLRRDKEALALWQAILQKAPKAPEAPEAAFWLAEHYFARKEFARARLEYHKLAARYPQSPRAAQARRWGRWLETADETWEEVEQTVAGWSRAVQAYHGAIGFTANVRGGEPHKRARLRVAFQDREHYLFALSVGDSGFLMANNQDGGWYRNLEDKVIVKTRAKLQLPMPRIAIRDDPAAGNASLQFTFHTNQDRPAVAIPLDFPAFAVSYLQGALHLGREARAGGAVVYRLESASWQRTRPDVWEVEVDARHQLRRVRYTCWSDAGKKWVCTLSDVTLDLPLPEDTFAVDVPEGATVRTVDKANPFEWACQLCKLAGKVFEEVRDAKK